VYVEEEVEFGSNGRRKSVVRKEEVITSVVNMTAVAAPRMAGVKNEQDGLGGSDALTRVIGDAECLGSIEVVTIFTLRTDKESSCRTIPPSLETLDMHMLRCDLW
jgi:hypothetical protein